MKKSTTKTTAENLLERFDAGEDVLDYFDLSRAVRHPGFLKVTGKPVPDKQRKTVKLSAQTVRRLEEYARKHDLPNFSAAIEAVAEKVG